MLLPNIPQNGGWGRSNSFSQLIWYPFSNNIQGEISKKETTSNFDFGTMRSKVQWELTSEKPQ